jgi:BirA family biotin operon repressor/biotin-[acetyl-CoA-carboxylase] ligase
VSPAFGHPHRHFRSCDSTNERARELAEAGAPAGTVVTADEQTAGRGRRGRRWSAPPETALLYSAVLSPLDERHALLPLAVPIAVCEAIERLAPLECRVKWPNDVWIGERKVAGVLIEARPRRWAVIGIGINLRVGDDEFPRELRWPATSVGHGATPAAALAALNERLSGWVEAPRARVVDAFRRRDALAGRAVAWEGAGAEGMATGIDGDGNLLVRDAAGGVHALGAGEITLRVRPHRREAPDSSSG